MEKLIEKISSLKQDERSPEGFYKLVDIEVFYNPQTKDLVITGSPEQFDFDVVDGEFVDEEPLEGDLRNHCCDTFGCGSLDHVIIKGQATETGF